VTKSAIWIVVLIGFVLILIPIFAEERKPANATQALQRQNPPLEVIPGANRGFDVKDAKTENDVERLERELNEKKRVLEELRRELKELNDPFRGKEFVPPWIP
jgi:predicted RNase H-like nuclease (RuvC/YqgF family)